MIKYEVKMFYYIGAKLGQKEIHILQRTKPGRGKGKTTYFAWYERELPWGGPEDKEERTRILESAKVRKEMWEETGLLREIESDTLDALASGLIDTAKKWEGPKFKESKGKEYDVRYASFVVYHYTQIPLELFSPPETGLMHIFQKAIPYLEWDTHLNSTPRRNLDLREQHTLTNAIIKELLKEEAKYKK